MRSLGMLLFGLGASGAAQAAEVVWLSPPSAEDAARLGDYAGARGGPLTPLDLQVTGVDVGPADAAAYERLAAALVQVRAYETRLDGELLIMEELAAPIGAVGVVRNANDRAALFAALAYQGFAVDRYFADDLGVDDRAAAYRITVDGAAIPKPWTDAVALDPERDVTPYDIAEAPQRVRYNQRRASVARQLPARLVPVDLPAGASIVVDGRVTPVGPTGTISVVPGRHLVHVEIGGRVAARFDVRLGVGDKAELTVPISNALIDGWTQALVAGQSPATPPALAPAIAALGGVWIATPGPEGPVAWSIGPDGPSAVAFPKDVGPDAESDGSIAVGLSSGWLSTGDFYTQDPVNTPNTAAAVNAATVGGGASFDLDFGAARVGFGVDVAVTLGADHVALFGPDGRTRLRTTPWVGVGIKPVGLVFGWTFPHHPAGGLRLAIPLGHSGLELRGLALAGLGLTRDRAGAESYQGSALYAANAGVGWRF